ncbi:hypothetical protein PLICRDRAFT_175031 [Plicaturopsis crispa FD-325 SS-3]|nr:hypothetical protein PLICRDRAFT_175031 [Plicaturopsis crispa FD-325 SS-3]
MDHPAVLLTSEYTHDPALLLVVTRRAARQPFTSPPHYSTPSPVYAQDHATPRRHLARPQQYAVAPAIHVTTQIFHSSIACGGGRILARLRHRPAAPRIRSTALCVGSSALSHYPFLSPPSSTAHGDASSLRVHGSALPIHATLRTCVPALYAYREAPVLAFRVCAFAPHDHARPTHLPSLALRSPRVLIAAPVQKQSRRQ